jgi:hypothetical protein
MNGSTASKHRVAGALAVAVALLSLLFVVLPASAQEDRFLTPGASTSGRIASALGEEWLLYACPGDEVTVTVVSAAFTPYLSIYTDTAEAPLLEAVSEDGERALAMLSVETGGAYTVSAAGERRSDRGPYSITVEYAGAADLALDAVAGFLYYGAVVTGNVQSSAGQVWAVRGCAGDVVTVTATSEQFTPYMELFDPAAQETISESVSLDDSQAIIDSAVFSTTGVVELIVAGVRRSDRGVYMLTVSTADTLTDGAEIITTVAPPRPTVAAATSTPQAQCIVRTSPTLNLRAGPGTNFSVIGVLRVDTQLRPLTRNADATWIEVQLLPTGQRGWVAGGQQFIECTINLMTLSLGVLPPTPTQQPTAPPTPTLPPVVVSPPTPTLPPVVLPPPPVPPAPTLPPLVVLPGGGPSADGWNGALVTGFGMARADSGVAVFRDRVYFRAEVEHTPNNRRIDRVEFRIEDENGDPFYQRTERVYGYCAFGGGEPSCNVLDIRSGARWPDTDRLLCNGDYTVFARIVLEDDSAGTWSSPFVIDNPNLPHCGAAVRQADLVVKIVQTGPGTIDNTIYGALVFQVEAFDPTRGARDGDGIRSVDLRIFDANGREVYQRTERVAGYCAFAGGEPNCNVWFFGDNGDAWPSGESVRYGESYLLRGVANAEDGRVAAVEMRVVVEP